MRKLSPTPPKADPRVTDGQAPPADNCQLPTAGFTLIEAIVGAMLFALTVAIATGFFVTVSRAQRKAFLESQILDGARYAMDTMAKALRVAEPIDMIVESNDPEIVITSIPPSIRFHHPMKSGTLGCPPAPPCIVTFAKGGTALTETDWDGAAGTPITFSLTGPRLIVDDFKVVDGSSILPGPPAVPSDVLQPRITLFLKVREATQPVSAAVSFQTTVTLRELQR